jgi:23S rRNA pseudouridine1911/1915/1917 synthase
MSDHRFLCFARGDGPDKALARCLGEQWVWVPFEVDKKFDGYRIDRFLTHRLVGYSRSKIQNILAQARVIKENRPAKANTKVRTGEKVQIAYLRRPETPLAADVSLPVLFEDEDLIIVNKSGDLLSHPTDKIVDHTVLGVLRHSRPDLPKLHLLHRLDRETSGVIALAKNVKAARSWTRDMEGRRIHKEYIAVVRGKVSPTEGVITMPIGREGGPIRVRQWVNVPGSVPATTKYRVDYFFCSEQTDQPGASFALSKRSVVRVFPETGRLHQIRVHFAALGHPLLGDPLYTGAGEIYIKMVKGTCTTIDRASLGFPRVALHAASLSFPHPITQQELRVEAPLPPDMEALIRHTTGGPALPQFLITRRSRKSCAGSPAAISDKLIAP